MNAYVPKPVDPETLYAALATWLPQKPKAPNPPASSGSHAEIVASLRRIQGIDIDRGLKNLAGRLPTYVRLLRMFIDTHGDDADTLRQQLGAGRTDEARRLAHSLKGASAALGAHELQFLAETLEHGIADCHSTEQTQDHLKHLNTALADLLDAIRANLPGEAPAPTTASSSDPKRLAVMIAALEELLAADDMRANNVLRENQSLLLATLGAEAATQIKRQIESFSYDLALKTLRTAVAALEPNTSKHASM